MAEAFTVVSPAFIDIEYISTLNYNMKRAGVILGIETVEIHWIDDTCTSSFTSGNNYHGQTFTLDVDQTQVLEWTPNMGNCEGFMEFRILPDGEAVSDYPDIFGQDSGFVTWDNTWTQAPVTDYTTRFTHSGVVIAIIGPTLAAHAGAWSVRVIFSDPSNANLGTQFFSIEISDPTPCDPTFTAPSPQPTGNVYTFDAVNNWIAYELGSSDDLTIEWAGASYGGCEFSSVVTVDGASNLFSNMI